MSDVIQIAEKRIRDYLASHDAKTADTWVWMRIGASFLVLVISYAILLWAPLAHSSWLVSCLIGILIALTITGLGLAILHEGSHYNLGKHAFVNELARNFSSVMTGVDCEMFRFRHVSVHHRFTNIYQHDGDISQTKIFRATPLQSWVPLYRYQHLYTFLLYGLMVISWTWISDFMHLFNLKISQTESLPKWTPERLSKFFLRKAMHLFFTILLPLHFAPLSSVLLGYLFIYAIVGFLVAIILQVSHVNEYSSFYEPRPLEGPFTKHQFTTTLSYACDNRVLTWYLAGVNLHLEHHMFPGVSHNHLPKLSKILRETCEEHGVRYPELPSLTASVIAHYRWLKRMGQNQNLL